jgi:adenylate cyclase
MPAEAVERRLTAILAADIAGYSRLVGRDEEGTLARLKALRRETIDPQIASHRGRIVKTTGDGLLVEFVSVVDAVRCAVAVQRACVESETALPQDRRIEFRIGINLGDIVVEGDDILGDGVNIAARLEGIAEPGGICISGVVHDQVRGKVEVAFVDLGEQNLKNIAQPVRAYRVLPDKTRTAASSRPLPLPDKPSIAVLPFQNMSGDPEQEYFADGMVEEIITALSRIRWLFVIARNSSFTYKGKPIDVKQVGRELGVRYILEGSVRKGGGRVRITAQLIDAATAAHLWADRFDGSMEDVFDLQDQVAISVAGVIEPALQTAEIRRSVDRPTSDLTAYDLYLRSLPLFWTMTRQGHGEARDLLEHAIQRDVAYGPALGWSAICHWQLSATWGENIEVNRGNAIDRAQRALRVAGNDPTVITNAALALSYCGEGGEDNGAMIALLDRALRLNPGSARGWDVRGQIKMVGGQPEAAIPDFESSLRLNPRDRFGVQISSLGLCYFFLRRFDEAVERLRLAVQENPGFPIPHRFLAACYAHMGRLDEAREMIARLRRITPVVMPPNTRAYRNAEHLELYLSGLRLAMGETT